MLGLEKGKVKLEEYNPLWADCFEQEKNVLLSVIGDYTLSIEHIGSTSIPGILAKPIIDITIGVESVESQTGIDPIIGLLVSLGYEYRGELGIPGRHFFEKKENNLSMYYLHMVEYLGELWKRHILFRDILRRNPEIAHRYEELKTGLAEKYSEDRDSYTEGKTEFIKKVLEEASGEKLKGV